MPLVAFRCKLGVADMLFLSLQDRKRLAVITTKGYNALVRHLVNDACKTACGCSVANVLRKIIIHIS